MAASAAVADVTWPAEQLLPSFSTPAPTQDLIVLSPGTISDEELSLFASLKGVVNATEPRIFSYEGDAFAEGPYTWLESLGLGWIEHADPWTLLVKYNDEIEGLVVYDPDQPHSLNLATTIAGREHALVAAPSLLPTLTAEPYAFGIVEDLRGRFSSALDVYQTLYDELWPELPHRALVGLSPEFHKGSLREYAVAVGAAVVWLDPAVSEQNELLEAFFTSMGPGTTYLGWWPDEAQGVERGSEFGVPTVAADYATNLTVHGGMPRAVDVKPIAPKPRLENKLYVAFVISDGDNLQYVEHLMRKLWNDPGRGQVPIGWTVSSAMLDAMPGALDFYITSGTANDALISGPSGWGYTYPNSVPEAALPGFVAVSDDYALRAGLRIVTVWNTITGGIDDSVGESFAAHAPSLLGLTAQNTGGGLTVYGGKLPAFAFSCNYCTDQAAIESHIAGAAAGWDGSQPRFILIQAQPWQGVTPTTFLDVKNDLSDDYVVVRPDNWFQLLRQHNGLPIEPVAPVADGVYRIANKNSGKCLTLTATASGSAVVQRPCADSDAQRWTVTETDSGYRRFAALSDESLVLDLEGGAAAGEDGAKLVVQTEAGEASQQWQPIWEAGPDYHLLARHSDRCLELPMSGTQDELQLQQWTCNGTSAQSFQFLPPTDPAPEPPPEPPATPDAGLPDDAGAPPDAGAGVPAADAGAPGTGPGAASGRESGGGCACLVAGRNTGNPAPLAAAVLAWWGYRLRRRR